MTTLPAGPDKPRPTRVRYLIVSVATLMSLMLYLHRYCLSFAERYIKDDLGLSNAQIGVLFSVFFAAYAVAQVPSGWLGDRRGVRPTLALYIFVWSLLTGLMGAATGFAAVLGLRFGCGLAQAGAYPAAASLVGRWVPFSRRALASSVVALGGRVGGAAAPVLTAYLLVAFVPPEAPATLRAGDLFEVPKLCRRLLASGEGYEARFARRVLGAVADGDHVVSGDAEALAASLNAALDRRDLCGDEELRELPLAEEAVKLAERPRDELTSSQLRRLNRLTLEAAYPEHVKKLYALGWRPVMAVYGVAGVLIAGLFWLCFRDWPADHPRCNAQEVALIEAGRPPVAARAAPLALKALLRSRSLWLISLSQFFTNFGWLFLTTWLPRYLAEVHKVPVLERGRMAAVPLAVGLAGMLGGGWLTDRLTRAVGLRWGRCLPLALSRFLGMGAFAACLLFRAPWPVVLALALVAVATDLGLPAVWAYNQDVGGRYVGSVLGWGNMWGNVGAAISPLALNAIVGGLGWDAAFAACAAAYLFSGLTALGVDARIPIVPPDEPLAA